MTLYRPFVDAVQWSGTNVTEIRQFVRTNAGYFNEVVIRNGILYLETATPDPRAGTVTIPVPVTNWVVRSGTELMVLSPENFASQYVLDIL